MKNSLKACLLRSTHVCYFVRGLLGCTSYAVTDAKADMTIGSCRFKGDKPRYTTSGGGIGDVHHQGEFKVVATRGSVYVYEGSGPIWVVWKGPNTRIGKVDFSKISGVQQCTDYL